MMVKGHMPPQALAENFPTDDPTEAVEKFVEEHPGAVIDTVGDKPIRNICSLCKAPIFVEDSADSYAYDADTKTYRCGECVHLKEGEDS
jgi:hypothetical protein